MSHWRISRSGGAVLSLCALVVPIVTAGTKQAPSDSFHSVATAALAGTTEKREEKGGENEGKELRMCTQ